MRSRIKLVDPSPDDRDRISTGLQGFRMCMCIDPQCPARDDPISCSHKRRSEVLYELMSVQRRISRTNDPKKWTIFEYPKDRKIERRMRDLVEVLGVFSITVHHDPSAGFSKKSGILLKCVLRKLAAHKLMSALRESHREISTENFTEMIDRIIAIFLHQKEFTVCEPYEVEV